MQTAIPEATRRTTLGAEAEKILRNCVHCGFCNATCPTYQLLGDELDGPRGRIYQIKRILEGNAATRANQRHLDRCLTCRACETTCPSGVTYGRLLDTGRLLVEKSVKRPLHERVFRRVLRLLLPYPARFGSLLRAGQLVRPLLPQGLRRRIPARRSAGSRPPPTQGRRMIILDGCVQPALQPQINGATTRVLDRLGISLISAPSAGCCGAMSHHLGAEEEALRFIRRNIDAWWPLIEEGAEAIVVTASGCAAAIKEYGHLLRDDDYAEKAAVIAERTRDLSEVLAAEDLSRLRPRTANADTVAFHSPCTLQHGMKLAGRVESILRAAGFRLTEVPDGHLCCGSAGTYSLLQPALAKRLRDNKLAALQSGKPARIATANIGCLMHLQTGTDVPVQHWIELLEPASDRK